MLDEVAAQYIEPEYAWREWSSGPYVIDAGARQVREEPTLTMVTSHNQASRMNKRLAKVKRPKYTLTGTLNLMGYYLRGHRFVRIQALGIDEVFEIGELWRNEGGLTFDITANSVEPTDFDFNAALEEPDRPALAQVANSDEIPDVTGLSVVPDGQNGLTWSWDPSDPAYSQQIRTRVGAGAWVVHDVPFGESSFTTTGFATEATVEGQARSVSAALRFGDWKPDTPVEGVVSGTKPGGLTGVSAAMGPGRLELTGTTGANTAGVRLYRNVADDLAGATDVSGLLSVSPLVAFDVTAGDPAAVNILSNPGFDDATDWSPNSAEWTIAGGVTSKASGSAASQRQFDTAMSQTLAADTDYRVSATVTARTSGGVRLGVFGPSGSDNTAYVFATGRFGEIVNVPTHTPDRFLITADNSFVGSLDDAALVPDTVSSLPHGQAYFWVIPVSAEGVEGPETALGQIWID